MLLLVIFLITALTVMVIYISMYQVMYVAVAVKRSHGVDNSFKQRMERIGVHSDKLRVG